MADKKNSDSGTTTSKFLRAGLAAFALMTGAVPDKASAIEIPPPAPQSIQAEADSLQTKGIELGMFSGTVENRSVILSGSYAQIGGGKPPIVHIEADRVIRSMFAHPINNLFADHQFDIAMTYFHERSHIEYQTGMSKRFEAPDMAKSDQESIINWLARPRKADTLSHGAMHERFAEIYGAYALIKTTDSAKDGELREFFLLRGAERQQEAFLNNLIPPAEFAHDLGRSMDIVNHMDFKAIRAMHPNQLKEIALRQTSLAYLADAKGHKKLSSNVLDHMMKEPESKILWRDIGKMSADDINKAAIKNLPAPADCGQPSTKPITNSIFGSNAPKCKPPSIS